MVMESGNVNGDTVSAAGKTRPANLPPDGQYGWVCVACVFLINAHTWGVNSSYGVFLSHYLDNNILPGASALEFAFVGGLSVSTALLISPVATLASRAFGTQAALSIGIVFETAGLLGASFASKIWHLFLSQGLAFGIGMGFLFTASIGIIPQWFLKKRSFANSIGAAGSGFGGLLYYLGANAMIQSIGLDWAFRILAIVSCAVNIVCVILVRDRNHAIGAVQTAFDVHLFKRGEFLLLLGWGFFSLLGYVVLLFSLPNYAKSIGLTTQQGSVVGAILNLGQGLGRPLVGYFSDAAGRFNLAALSTFLAGLFCLLIWIFANTYGVLIFFALIVGSVAGTFWTTVAPLGVEVVGLQMLPSAISIIFVFISLPSTFAEPIGLKLRSPAGDIYEHAQIFTGFMYIAASICIWFLRAWKVRELEKLTKMKETEVNRDDAILIEGEELSRQRSTTASAKGIIKMTEGLWSLQHV